jgi:ribosomal protein S18 acetylase RimI-like enzyme
VIELHSDLPVPGHLDVEVGPGQHALVATDGGRSVGAVVWRLEQGHATVDLVTSGPDGDRDPELLAALQRHAVDAGARTMAAEVGADQTALLTQLQGATVLSTFMVKPVPAEPPALPTGFAARDMTPDEFTSWKTSSIDSYAEENLARSGGNRELARQRSLESFARLLPDDAATPHHRLLTLVRDGEPVGDLWLRHHWPRYRDAVPADDQTFTFDVAISADRRGQGLGRAAMLAAERFAIEVGDHQLGLNVFGDNDVANGLYRSLGYTARSTVLDVPLP